jgi:FkbM family methyltransferase
LSPDGTFGPRVRTLAATGDKVQRHAQIWRLRREYERRSAGRDTDEVVVRSGITLKVHPESRASFEEFSYSSPQQVEELDVFLDATKGRSRLLDVGALHGIFSLVFAAGDRSRQALAVDPSPAAFAKLLYNVHRNGAENVTAVECALSDKSGVLEMHLEWERAVAGALAMGAPALRVQMERGDDIVERYAFEPDVVKIDVDGHELRVVQGLAGTFRRARPLLFLEIHPQMIASVPANGTLAELIKELRELGYEEAELHGSLIASEALRALSSIDRVLLRPE